MAKTDAKRRSKRQSKVVASEVEEEDKTGGTTENVPSSEQMAGTEEDAPSESTEMKQEEEAVKENQDEQDPQMDTVIEVKGSTTTVTVSWDKKNKEVCDSENGMNASDQMMETEEHISSANAVGSTEDATSVSAETEMKEEIQESGDTQNEHEATVTVTLKKKKNKRKKKKKTEEGKSDDDKRVVEKRKACSAAETSPPKKTKLINDGFCLFVGNLNHSKKFDEVKESLASFFMKQSLLFQDIRLDRSRKHAFIDLASEMDLTKGLTLNGEMMHDKPMRIAKAKVKSEEDVVKVKLTAEERKAAQNEKCLFLKNIPYTATKQDILEIYPLAVDVRFPGGAQSPDRGIAFVEFETKTIAEEMKQQKKKVKIQNRVLTVDHVGDKHVTKTTDDKDKKKAPVFPNKTLFVNKLPLDVKETDLKKAFQKAVGIVMPQTEGKSKGYAFVEFATVAEAEKVIKSSKNIQICRKPIGVHFSEVKEKSEPAKVLTNSLAVMGLAEKTTAETLQRAFEGASSARVIMDKKTGVSKRFGFVDFESEDVCKAAKEAMEDGMIDGSQVTVAFAKDKSDISPESPVEPPPAPDAQPAGQEAAGRKRKVKRGKGGKKGKGSGAETPQDAVQEVENKE